ncbi:MAG TPA: hypothetical protein VNA69_04265 [Thermoanaerobaculia bacterium]|nr:hypothetical protein [Thermoanaerobaculia bacterium]
MNQLRELDPVMRAGLPALERLLDRLADVMFDAEEARDVLLGDDASALRWVDPHLRNVYDEINQLMKRLCD